jgi:hypothetical protein
MGGHLLTGEVMITVAALYVERGGIYSSLPNVDPWPIDRDAREYRGPATVVAHPPCKRWGRYWSGGPSARVRRRKGDDGGCFAHALWTVRTFGGVIEHPEASHAWPWFGLTKPARKGGWTELDSYGGRSCCVEQGHYDHRARKATWLYAVTGQYPELLWGPSKGLRLDAGYHSAAERRSCPRKHTRDTARISAKECAATPRRFAEVLIGIARAAGKGERRCVA